MWRLQRLSNSQSTITAVESAIKVHCGSVEHLEGWVRERIQLDSRRDVEFVMLIWNGWDECGDKRVRLHSENVWRYVESKRPGQEGNDAIPFWSVRQKASSPFCVDDKDTGRMEMREALSHIISHLS